MRTASLPRGVVLTLVVVLLALLTACGGRRSRGKAPKGPELVKGGVLFRYYDPDATKVHLAGNFNNWSQSYDPMVDRNGDGEWTLFYPMSPGRYEYKFVVNGVTWIPDPRNVRSAPDGFEGRNSVIQVPQMR